MAILIPHKTTCVLCHDVIDSPDDVVAFPAFIPPGHKMSKYSDSIFHGQCFRNWDGGETLQHLYASYCEIWDGRPGNLQSVDEITEWGKTAFASLFEPGRVRGR